LNTKDCPDFKADKLGVAERLPRLPIHEAEKNPVPSTAAAAG